MSEQPPISSSPSPRSSSASVKRWPKVVAIVAVVLIAFGGCCWGTFALVFGSLGNDGTVSASGNKIALIHIDAAISGTEDVTPEEFKKSFDDATDDVSVKAIVLRVDSPGGTVAASQEIAQYVKDSKKPVVISVGDLCASGAYMVASQADKIVALPGSSVGSIGVIMEVPNISELLKKLGVDVQVLKTAPRKDEGSPYRPLTKDEITALQGDLNDINDQFIDLVAKGRGLTTDQVRTLATGETYIGTKALDLDLIDKLGTEKDATDLAASLAKVRKNDYEAVSFDASADPFEDILSSFLGLTSSNKGLFEKSAPVAR